MREIIDIRHIHGMIADAAVMLGKVSEVNETKQYYKAKLGIKDMQFCIDFASLLIKYGG